jgi:hypothetical protein
MQMTYRSLVSAGASAVVMAAVVLASAETLAGQSSSNARATGAPAKAYTPPKTADGQPDLSGYWTSATYTPLQRPSGITKEFYTPEEVDAAVKRAAELEADQTVPGTAADVHYDDGQFGLAKSQSTLARNLRTSLITDPPDGRIPPQTEEAVRRNAALAEARKLRGSELDAVQNMGYDDRCIIMVGTAPPIFNPGYMSNYQIIQSPGYVTILVERLHDARVIPLDGRPFPPSGVRSWRGISRGRWEGNTLVVETRNQNGRVQASAGIGNGSIVGATEDLRVVERFTRIDENTIEYRFTLEDSRTWARPWSAEIPFARMDPQGPFFEMACHEGNRAPMNMLSVARHAEKVAAEAAKKKSSN